MQCQYCIKHFDYKIVDEKLYIRKSQDDRFRFYARIDHLLIRAYKCLEKLNDVYDVGLLTFSGSEVFLFKSIFWLLKKADSMFENIQVITNGLNINEEVIKGLKELKNVHVTLSLDGNTLESNVARTIMDQDKLDKILEGIDLLIENNIPVDIYTVISKYNIENLRGFFKFLESKNKNMGLQLWPVFGNVKLQPSGEQLSAFKKVIDNYDSYSLRLQPKVYMEYVLDYLKSGERNLPCYLPFISAYLHDNGDIEACLCNGVVKTGNIFNDSVEAIEEIKDGSFYKDITKYKHSILPCRKCLINWDIFNLYFCDRVTIEEIQVIPLFSNRKFIDMTKEFKTGILK